MTAHEGQNISSTRAFSLTDRRKTIGCCCIRYFCGRMPRYLRSPLTGYANGIPGRAQTCSLRFWRPLFHHLNYGNIKSRPWNRTSRVYTHAPRSKLRSGGHIKTAPVLRRGCWLAHILSGKLHLGKDSKAFSRHGRLHVRPFGLSSPCAIWCSGMDLNQLLAASIGCCSTS